MIVKWMGIGDGNQNVDMEKIIGAGLGMPISYCSEHLYITSSADYSNLKTLFAVSMFEIQPKDFS